MVCSACGYENQSGHRFCGMCGMPLPHRPLTTPGAQSTIGLTRVPMDSGGNGGTGRSQEIHTPADLAGQAAEAMHESHAPAREMVPAVSLDEYIKNFRYIPPTDPDEVTMRGETPVAASQASSVGEEMSSASRSEEAVAKVIVDEAAPAETSGAETTPEESEPAEVVASSVASQQADPERAVAAMQPSVAADAIVAPEVFPAKDIAIASETSTTEAAPPTAPVKEIPIVAAPAVPVVADDVRERLGLDASGPAEEPERSRFLDLAKPAAQERSGTSSLVGPSFLGLDDSLPATDSAALDDDVPEESSTHWRYWMVAAIVLLAVILGGLQWRAQVNQTTGPLEVVRLKLRQMRGETAPAQNTAATTAASNGASQPAITVEQPSKPANNAAANGSSATPAGVPPGAGSSTATNNPAQPPANSNPASSVPVNSSNAAAPASSAATTASAKPPTPAVTTSTSSPVSKPPATSASSASGKNTQTAQTSPPKKPAPTDNAKNAKPVADNNKPAAKEAIPGDEELVKANNASDSVAEAAWLWKATAKGNPVAPVRLADMYVKGNGVPRSCEQAMVLLKTAATKENAPARNRLASMYSTGTCVARNRVEAYRWMSSALSADPNSDWAQQNRESLWNQMTPDERAEAEKYR